jgi:hypothetical protein
MTNEESYTSKCSFIDNEPIEKHKIYCGKRLRTIQIHGKKVKCNLFRRKNGQLLNGDVNGAYNILRKAVPNAFATTTRSVMMECRRSTGFSQMTALDEPTLDNTAILNNRICLPMRASLATVRYEVIGTMYQNQYYHLVEG